MLHVLTLTSVVVLCVTGNASVKEDEIRAKRSLASIESRLRSLVGGGNVPKSVSTALAALDDSMGLISCLPTSCSGNCCTTPGTCSLSQFNKDPITEASGKITLCKQPWTIRIDLNARITGTWYRLLGRLKFNPIIIRLDNQELNGITEANTNVRVVSASALGIRIYKVNFIFNLFVRWDCTRPKYNTRIRNRYNRIYGNRLVYKVKARIEVKKKSFKWLRLNWKCKRCEDVVNKSGTIGYGPSSCNAVTPRRPIEKDCGCENCRLRYCP